MKRLLSSPTVPSRLAIDRIELFALHVPFRQAVRDAMARSPTGLGMAIPAEDPWLGGDFVIARLTADDGTQGVGEAFVWLPETGVSPAQIVDAVQHGLAQHVLGADPADGTALCDRMDANVARTEVAKGLLDMACVDLVGHATGRPAHALMGAASAPATLPLAALIPLADPEFMVGLASGFHRDGTRTFRLKLGSGIEADRHVVALAREALGSDVRLRVDYNQAYSRGDAIRAIAAIARYGIDCAEQPVRAGDWLGMAEVQRAVTVPLMAHESCFSLTDVTALIALGAVRVVGINTERPGGITRALQAMDHATAHGLGIVLHNQPLGIASAAQVHLGAARAETLGHAMELFGHIMLEDDLIVERLDYSGGVVRVPEGPGLGVTLDVDALDGYLTAPPVVIGQ
jgi:muconate cycloisomerase